MNKKKIIAIVGMLVLLIQLPILKADVQTDQYTTQFDMISYDYSNENELRITFQLPELVETSIQTEKGYFTSDFTEKIASVLRIVSKHDWRTWLVCWT